MITASQSNNTQTELATRKRWKQTQVSSKKIIFNNRFAAQFPSNLCYSLIPRAQSNNSRLKQADSQHTNWTGSQKLIVKVSCVNCLSFSEQHTNRNQRPGKKNSAKNNVKMKFSDRTKIPRVHVLSECSAAGERWDLTSRERSVNWAALAVRRAKSILSGCRSVPHYTDSERYGPPPPPSPPPFPCLLLFHSFFPPLFSLQPTYIHPLQMSKALY